MSIPRLVQLRARCRSSRRPRWMPTVMELEVRRLLSAYVVNDSGDALLDPSIGPGETANGTITLRSAIEQINMDGGGSITFASAMTISVNSALDPVTAGVTIDGGSAGLGRDQRDHSGYNGLVIEGGGATIQNLEIESFLVGIVLQSSQNTIQYNDIRPDVSNSDAGGNVCRRARGHVQATTRFRAISLLTTWEPASSSTARPTIKSIVMTSGLITRSAQDSTPKETAATGC